MERSHQLDFFRGLFLIIITIDHFLAENNIIKHFTYEFIGWVTAAEGFVFLSGLTAGLVYTHKLVEKGGEFISRIAIKRAWLIYKNHMALLIMVLIMVNFIPYIHNYWAEYYQPMVDNEVLSLTLGALLLYQPYDLDILPMYAVFIIATPVVIKIFVKRQTWLVLLLSILIYAVGYAYETYLYATKPKEVALFTTGYFNLFCWQLLFLMGLMAGFAFYHARTDAIRKNKFIFIISIIVCLTLFLLKNLHAEFDSFDIEYIAPKPYLGPLRIFNFIALLCVVIHISYKNNQWFKYKPICYLGRNSLDVFVFHIVLLIIFMPLKQYLNSMYSIKITHFFNFYPIGSAMVFFLIVPALYLAPTLLNLNYKAMFKLSR